MTTKHEEKVAEIMEKVEKGKADDLTPAEQHAYDKAVADANEEKGYEPFVWSGVPMFRILDEPDRTFQYERDAAEWMMRSRLRANLAG